eukprot:gene28474-37424_t
MSLIFGEENGLSFAKVTFSASANEDRGYCHLGACNANRDENFVSTLEDISSFGVFDGHGGASAAEKCADKVHKKILSRFLELFSYFLRSGDLSKSLLSVAINESIRNIHEDIIYDDNSGCTMASVFIFPVTHDSLLRTGADDNGERVSASTTLNEEVSGRSFHVVCANTGDSRCVVITCSAESGFSDHFSTHTSRSLSSTTVAPVMVEQTAPTSSRRADSERSYHADDAVLAEGQSRSVRVRVSVTAMSDDHSLNCNREKYRILRKVDLAPLLLPVPLSVFPRCREKDSVVLRAIISPGSDANCQSIEIELRAEEILRKLLEEDRSLNLVRRVEPLLPLIGANDSFEEKQYWRWTEQSAQLLVDPQSPVFNERNVTAMYQLRLIVISRLMHRFLMRSPQLSAEPERHAPSSQIIEPGRIMRQSSFIHERRIGEIIGPPAFFAGDGQTSLLMTRSIGDRKGPRGCIAQPDLTCLTVNATQHARFVIASDGMWDVIDNETVRRLALLFKHRKPADLALHLARKAVRRRIKFSMRGDDITVLVVDVNPQNAMYVTRLPTDPVGFYHAVKAESRGSNSPVRGATPTEEDSRIHRCDVTRRKEYCTQS